MKTIQFKWFAGVKVGGGSHPCSRGGFKTMRNLLKFSKA